MAHKRNTIRTKKKFTKEQKDIIKELKARFKSLDMSGLGKGRYRFYVTGSVVKGEFKKSSDIDIFIAHSIGAKDLLENWDNIEKRLGKEINGHKIHIWSSPSAIEVKDFGEEVIVLGDKKV